MASSPVNVKLDVDDATNNATAPSQPPPNSPFAVHPYTHPSHTQWLPPSYPSTTPPDYCQTSGSKVCEASIATGSYLYSQYPQHVVPIAIQAAAVPGAEVRPPSFIAHVALSCYVFCCCCFICGGVAFIVACKLIVQSVASLWHN